MKKIAFLFLIYDVINHEELWNIFFKNIDKNLYNIYIHYKYNVPLKYFEKNKLDFCMKTKYADISLVKAQNLLLSKGLTDENNTHFIFISNSCVPFKSFITIYNFLKDDMSYFNLSTHSQCFPRCNKTLQYIDKQYIQKASQWCILCRNHANMLINDSDYLSWFNYSNTVPDEHCYITKLFYEKLTHEIVITHMLSNNATTFTNWEGNTYKYPSYKGLKNYKNISQDEILYLLNSKCLFGRKFDKECINDFVKNKYINVIQS